ncbi:MAG: hypothetical protein IT178_05990 [Acidobacteria bacterium]|nr:hypothetical protein [Acidobacteriota bacterium]
MRHLAFFVVRFLCAALLAALAAPAAAQVAMPDAGQMSGIPLPAPELAVGTVGVRVVRERMGNNVAGQAVTVTANGQAKTATTDAQGRAEFSGFAPGDSVIATATVDGETLTSQPLLVPSRGGMRVALVAGVSEAQAREAAEAEAAAKQPARQGIVVIGGQSRLVLEFQSDVLTVFYLLDIVNNARTPIDPGAPLDIELPRDAGNPALMEGSTTQATLRGTTVRVTGPFAPGTTSLQVGYSLADAGKTYQLSQRWPAAFEQPFVAVEKIGDLQMTSAQLPNTETINADGGKQFILANGGRLAEGDTLTFTLTNLPAHSRVPRWTAVGIAALVVLGFGIFAFGPSAQPERSQLQSERARLMHELVAIEERRRAGKPKARDHERRPALVAELERVMAALDDAPGGGQGAAA